MKNRTLDRPHEVCDARLLRINASQWTRVTDQTTPVANLISMYLSWDHATLRMFDEELFLDQIAAGQTDYCSPAFVNALLAAACVSILCADRAVFRRRLTVLSRSTTGPWTSRRAPVSAPGSMMKPWAGSRPRRPGARTSSSSRRPPYCACGVNLLAMTRPA